MLHAENADNQNTFELQKARTHLKKIERDLKQKKLPTEKIDQTRSFISLVEDKTQDCIKNNRRNLSQLEALSPTYGTPEQAADNKNFLEQEKRYTKAILSDCELLLYETQTLKKKVNLFAESTAHNYQFKSEPKLWELENINTLLVFPAYDLQSMQEAIGTQYFNTKNTFFTFIGILLVNSLVAFLLYKICQFLFHKKPLTKRLIPPLKKYLAPGIFLATLYFSLSLLFRDVYPEPLIKDITRLLGVFFVMCFFIIIVQILYAYKKSKPIAMLSKNIATGASFLLGILIITEIVTLLTPTTSFKSLNLSLYAIGYLLILAPTCFYLCKSTITLLIKRRILSWYGALFITSMLGILFIGLLIATGYGSGSTTFFIANRLIKSGFLIAFMSIFVYAIWHCVSSLKHPSHPVSLALQNSIGLKPGTRHFELSLLRIFIILAVLRKAISTFFSIWDLPQSYLVNVSDYIQNNLHIFSIPINPISLLRGFAAFCIIIVLGAFISAYVAKHSKTLDERNTRSTITTLINYVSFIIAIFVALMVAGVNLSGFALVASALSVGIGFGLKGIAADMVSGLILLLNKPLRQGDHITIDNTEGFIERIRLLSTHIKTIHHRSSVVLPNSALLSKSVFKYAYKNKQVLIESEVMLKDIKDVDAVKKIMLKIAKKHPEIRQEGKSKPEVIVELRTQKNALQVIVTLRCLIKDFDERYRINSEINAKILAAIQKAEIALKI